MFFIAEAGVNHNGDIDLALKLVDIAADAGADAVKFQTFKADKTVRTGTKTVEYQKVNAEQDDQQELLRRLELSEEDHYTIAQRCKERGIEFMSTAFDEECADFLASVGISRIKIPSGELTNLPFIKHLVQFDLPIILSTGMGNMDEIKQAYDLIRETRQEMGFGDTPKEKLSILHCTSAYPTPNDQLNLRAITTIANAFECAAGYSDHSGGLEAGYLAVALGATVYEKHFTVDRNLPGPDHKASLEPEELKTMIDAIRRAEKMLGTGIKEPQPCELQARDLVRRSVFAAKDLAKGQIISASDLIMLRPASGIEPKYAFDLIGKAAKRDIKNGDPFTMDDL